jgi:uncharacterized Zn finger protein
MSKSDDKDTTIICPNCLREMDMSEAIKGEGENAIFECPYCHEKGKNPIA